MKLKFVHILALSAFILAGTAAYFSVTGLAKLFSGAFWPVIIMVGGLELAKLVIASYLYRYWDDISKLFRIYLMISVGVIMIITSAGIYGFLSSAYSATSSKMDKVDKQIEFLEKKKEVINKQVVRNEDFVKNKNNRISTLTSIRINQEARIDTLYKKNYLTSIKRTEGIIKDANIEIEKANNQIDSLTHTTQICLDSISKIDLQILQYKNSDTNSEIGTLRYIAILTSKDINTVVNFFMFLLIFVFDPLAICLVVATNKVILIENDLKKKL